MKDKTITDEHFDYTNELVKILGFNSLCDFETSISYDLMKKNQNDICNKFTNSLCEFKKLFSQEGFELRKISYKFENIDQVIGFLKKLFCYLSIGFDYSRVRGVRVMRLIQPNNLYNNYIIKMRKNPQNLNLCEKKSIEDNSVENLVVQDDLAEDSMSDVQSIKLFLENIPESTLTEGNVIYNTQSMKKILEKLVKINVSKKNIVKKRTEISYIDVDWIENITLSKFNKTNITIGTTLSLIIGNNEIIIYTFDKDTPKQKINVCFPNNFIYPHTQVKLCVLNDMIEKEDFTCVENLSDEFDFVMEIDGFNIANKEIFGHGNEYDIIKNIIEFDHNELYSCKKYDIKASNGSLKIKIGDEKLQTTNDINDINDTNDVNCTNNVNSGNIYYMSNIIKYLKKPFEKKYIVGNNLLLNHLINTFEYFNWIKIRFSNDKPLKIGTKIILSLGGIEALSKTIEDESKISNQFDSENYYKFDIDFPNEIFYKYNEIRLNIVESFNKNKLNYIHNNYEIIIMGSTFKTTLPKYYTNLNSQIIYNHDSKWYVERKIKYCSISGMVGNMIPSESKNKEIKLLEYINKNHKLGNISVKYICVNKILSPVIFINSNEFAYNKCSNYLLFLVSDNVRKLLFDLEYIKSSEYLFGSNTMMINIKPTISEINSENVKLYYEITKNFDLIEHIKVIRENVKSKYNFKSWIESNQKKLYDFGSNEVASSTILNINSQYVNIIANYIKTIWFVIEIPLDKYSDWATTDGTNSIDIELGVIFANTLVRKNLAYADREKNIMICENIATK